MNKKANALCDENDFWKVCAALDNPVRLDLLKMLVESKNEFPCVLEIAEKMRLCCGTTSAYLKQLREVGLVSSACADGRVFYRAFPTREQGRKALNTLTAFFETRPTDSRLAEFFKVVRALAHRRRLSYLRHLDRNPGVRLIDAARALGVPCATLDRMFDQLGHAHLVDLHGCVTPPGRDPEDALLALALE